MGTEIGILNFNFPLFGLLRRRLFPPGRTRSNGLLCTLNLKLKHIPSCKPRRQSGKKNCTEKRNQFSLAKISPNQCGILGTKHKTLNRRACFSLLFGFVLIQYGVFFTSQLRVEKANTEGKANLNQGCWVVVLHFLFCFCC